MPILLNESVRPGDAVKIRVFLYDGTTVQTGLAVGDRQLAIERVDDGLFWNGSTWQAGFTTVTMTEISNGDSHTDGVLEYDFTTDSDVEHIYDWSHELDLGTRPIFHRGRIRTYSEP